MRPWGAEWEERQRRNGNDSCGHVKTSIGFVKFNNPWADLKKVWLKTRRHCEDTEMKPETTMQWLTGCLYRKPLFLKATLKAIFYVKIHLSLQLNLKVACLPNLNGLNGCDLWLEMFSSHRKQKIKTWWVNYTLCEHTETAQLSSLASEIKTNMNVIQTEFCMAWNWNLIPTQPTSNILVLLKTESSFISSLFYPLLTVVPDNAMY